MKRTRVKICGITRREDAMACARLGADAMGLVFYDKSPRAVSIEQASEVIAGLPAFMTTVGLFVDPEVAEVEQVLASVSLDCLQFHGNETASFCTQFKRPYIKAIRMEPGIHVSDYEAEYHTAGGLLLDTYVAGVPGGTGQTFDWDRVPQQTQIPIILAGGLKPDNVAEAISATQPYAVDVSGGVEQAKGIKQSSKIEQFMSEVNRIG